MKIDRAKLRGKPLDDDCKRAKISKHEYGIKDNRCFCYGLFASHSNEINDKCLKCGAYCGNAKPIN